jgi:hypothetical protein
MCLAQMPDECLAAVIVRASLLDVSPRHLALTSRAFRDAVRLNICAQPWLYLCGGSSSPMGTEKTVTVRHLELGVSGNGWREGPPLPARAWFETVESIHGSGTPHTQARHAQGHWGPYIAVGDPIHTGGDFLAPPGNSGLGPTAKKQRRDGGVLAITGVAVPSTPCPAAPAYGGPFLEGPWVPEPAQNLPCPPQAVSMGRSWGGGAMRRPWVHGLRRGGGQGPAPAPFEVTSPSTPMVAVRDEPGAPGGRN